MVQSDHKREHCREMYGEKLKLVKEQNPGFNNTMAADQVFLWLGRFKKILCAMDKCHHMFCSCRSLRKQSTQVMFRMLLQKMAENNADQERTNQNAYIYLKTNFQNNTPY